MKIGGVVHNNLGAVCSTILDFSKQNLVFKTLTTQSRVKPYLPINWMVVKIQALGWTLQGKPDIGPSLFAILLSPSDHETIVAIF